LEHGHGHVREEEIRDRAEWERLARDAFLELTRRDARWKANRLRLLKAEVVGSYPRTDIAVEVDVRGEYVFGWSYRIWRPSAEFDGIRYQPTPSRIASDIADWIYEDTRKR
jgi:hypothetical protein